MARARTVAASNFDRNMRVANQGDDVHSFPWVGARLGARRLVVSWILLGVGRLRVQPWEFEKGNEPIHCHCHCDWSSSLLEECASV